MIMSMSMKGPEFGSSFTEASPGMHVCPDCNSGDVEPIDWSLVGTTHWSVTLRCPQCEKVVGTGLFSQKKVDAFDRKLDKDMGQLQSDLDR